MTIMRILAIDPGAQRIGVAISDPTGTIASPLTVLRHISRQANAAAILKLAREAGAARIVVGESLDEDGQPTVEGRRARRLAGALRDLGDLPVVLWDEGGSTQAARAAQLELGVPKSRRRRPVDALAATVMLQSYLEFRREDRPS